MIRSLALIPPFLELLERRVARISGLTARLAERLVVAGLVTAVGVIPAVAHGLAGGCVLRIALFAIAFAAVASLGINPQARLRRRTVRVAESAFTILEVLVTTAVVSIVIVGATFVYGSQRGSTSREVNADSLRDVTSAIDVDASAISAYDSNARAAFSGLAPQTTTVTVNGNATKVKLDGVAAGALSVTASTGDGSQAAVLLPLPVAKPLPK